MDKKTILRVKGMHCRSCEVLIKTKFSEEKNIKAVKPNFKTQTAEITFVGELNQEKLNQKIKPFGYQIVEKNGVLSAETPFYKKLIEVVALVAIVFLIYTLAQDYRFLPAINFSGKFSLAAVFILGLAASVSTCMATSGSLFLATVGKLKQKSIWPAINFNSGRLFSYGFFGFAAGAVGRVLVGFQLGVILSLVVAILMILLGLDMFKIISFASILPTGVTSGFFEKIQSRLIKNPKQTSFLLGVVTFFLPCGFTQTTQIYALSLANPLKSALVMIIFALGTIPVLLAMGFAYSLTSQSFYPALQKIIASVVMVVGLVYLNNSLNVYGINVFRAAQTSQTDNLETNVTLEKGYQVARMTVDSLGYSPTRFIVKKNLPVKWIINGENVFGCQGYFVVPSLNYHQNLKPGENLIEFTPKETGTVNFSCGMGMYRGYFEVVDG